MKTGKITLPNLDYKKVTEEIYSFIRKIVEESQALGLEKEVVEGMQFDQGYVSPYMMTDANRMETILENPSILITDKKISAISEIMPLLETLANAGKKEFVIIAEDVDGEALATLVVNNIRGIVKVAAVKAPGFGDRRKAMLEDIAVLTGGQCVTEDLGIKLEGMTPVSYTHLTLPTTPYV